MAERRALTIASLDEVMPEVDRLLGGHKTIGTWSLGQICNHLTSAFKGAIEGFPKKVGPVYFRKILKEGIMPEGVKLPEEFLPKPGLDDRAEAEALRAALRFYTAHVGPMAEHPFFGPISRDEWTQIHCIHCAHHLSFVLPGDRRSD